MRAMSTKAVGAPLGTATARSAAWVAVAGAVAVWTALVVLIHADPGRMDLTSSARSALIYGVPALVATAMVFDSRVAAIRPLRWALAWCALVVGASFAADRLSADHARFLVAIPALALAAVVFGRRPAAAVTLAFAM